MEKKVYYKNIAGIIIKNLEKRQIEGYYFEDKKSALEKVLELIPEESTIGWGGSKTLEEVGVFDALKNRNYNMIDRSNAKTFEEQRACYKEIFDSDYFLMSINAITVDGELINIDGRGNRVSFLCYGPQNVVILCGINKIVTDVEAGIKRTRNIAAPPNAVRLNRKTPCATTGKCEDCYSPDCMCGQIVVTRFSLISNRIKVILVGENLGY